MEVRYRLASDDSADLDARRPDAKADDEASLRREDVGDAPKDVAIRRRRHGRYSLAIGILGGGEDRALHHRLRGLYGVAVEGLHGGFDPEVAVDDHRLPPFRRCLLHHTHITGNTLPAGAIISHLLFLAPTD